MKNLLVLLAVAAAFAAGGYYYGKRQPHGEPQAAATAAKADAGRKILYWHDPMYPQHRFDKPGRSPFMNMDLVPVYADGKAGEEGGKGGEVRVSPRVRQSLGMRTAAAEMVELRQDLPAVGYVQADERRIARAEVRASGWVEKLHVRAVNDPVRAGQELAEIYSPELYAAQGEYLLVRRMAKENPADEPLARGARQRLALLGMPEAAIAAIEQSGAASRRVALLAPISGVVSELGVREGTMVQAGMAAFTLTDLSSVWLAMEVPEAQAGLLRQGQPAVARVRTLPGKVFEGRIDYVYPELNAQTRTVKARVVLSNPGLALKPGMFADVSLATSVRKALTVPTEAVIQTGTRSVVIVAEDERFRAATVKVGAESGGRSEILEGLKAGERVVASGQFLIDSEASLRTTLSRLEGEPKAEAKPGTAPSAGHRGLGKVTGLDPLKGRIELEHEPIPALKWPKMTMEFVVEDKASLTRLRKGEAVEFEVQGEPNKDGDWVIGHIAPRGAK
jgi:Cu(I)/Ag(I) efflux system membrane fusion protein